MPGRCAPRPDRPAGPTGSAPVRPPGAGARTRAGACGLRACEVFRRARVKYRERTGEIYAMQHSPRHRWVYFPLMQASQALLLKTFDSETDGRARFMGHTAFEDPTTPPGAMKPESIEVRTMAFF
ncbi:MAG: CmcJ/NvfI family oxidoreductase [Rubrivivax sp.]